MHLMRGRDAAGAPPVLTCSAQDGQGIDEVWDALARRRLSLEESGELAARRREQRVRWMWAEVERRLRAGFEVDPELKRLAGEAASAVASGVVPPSVAAERLLAALRIVRG